MTYILQFSEQKQKKKKKKKQIHLLHVVQFQSNRTGYRLCSRHTVTSGREQVIAVNHYDADLRVLVY